MLAGNSPVGDLAPRFAVGESRLPHSHSIGRRRLVAANRRRESSRMAAKRMSKLLTITTVRRVSSSGSAINDDPPQLVAAGPVRLGPMGTLDWLAGKLARVGDRPLATNNRNCA